MGIDYLESLFTGMDIIIDKRLKELSFDKTIVCTVVYNENKKNGEYRVSDGAIEFIAYSDSNKYQVNDQVLVKIPQGDYTKEKFIEGRYVNDNNTSPITYISPLDTIVNISGNLVDNSNTQYGIVANGDLKEKVIWAKGFVDEPLSKITGDGIYDTITLRANFRTLLNDYHLYEGRYGLKLEIYTKASKDSNTLFLNTVILDSSEMFGNPYMFSVYSRQEKSFLINTEGYIHALKLILYQNGGFKDLLTNELIPKNEISDNILVKDIELGIGSDLTKVSDNALKLYTVSDPQYKYYGWTPETNDKQLGLLWYNKDDNNKFLGFSDGVYDENYDEREYLVEVSAAARLKAQLGRENTPTDETSLILAANIEEGEQGVIKARNLITKDIHQELINLSGQLSDVKSLYDIVISFDNSLSVYYDNITQELEKVKADYKNILKYGYDLEQGLDATRPTLYGFISELKEYFTNFNNNSLTMMNDLLESINDNYSGYLGIYNTYNTRLNRLLEKIVEIVDGLAFFNDKLDEYSPDEPFTEPDLSEYANRYSIYWYRYNAAAAGDDFMPAGWEEMTELADFGLSDKDNETGFHQVAADPATYATIEMRHDEQEEKFVVVLFYNHVMYKSNELIFTNADEVPNKTMLDAADALIIEHLDNSYDNYYIYNLTNNLNNIADKSLHRKIRCHYDGLLASNEILKEADVYWYVPNNDNSMLIVDDKWLRDKGFITDNSSKTPLSLTGYDYYYKKISDESVDCDFWYMIKPYYSHTAKKNDIICKVKLYGSEDYLQATVLMSFGIEGTSGTHYTLVITNSEVNKIAITASEGLDLDISLRDYENEKIPIALEENESTADAFLSEQSWDLKIKDVLEGNPEIQTNLEGTELTKIKIGPNLCGILRTEIGFKIPEQEKFKTLTSLDPIPYTLDSDYYISGPTHIIYNSLGTLDNMSMFNQKYKLWSYNDNKEITQIGLRPVNWSIDYYIYDENKQLINLKLVSQDKISVRDFYLKYMPKLTEDNRLVPAPMYLDGLDCYAVVSAYYDQINLQRVILWQQPIIILQNRYSSSLLNDWDGSFQIDEEDGTILSTMVGAGRKTVNNTFEGVLMGNVGAAAGIETPPHKTGLGIYGFNDGAQSFGLNIDGTAFFGKAGRGRIEIDGNKGTISSASYQQNVEKAGMLIDLDDGFIDILGAKKNEDESYSEDGTNSHIRIDSKSPYVQIISEGNNPLLYISNNEYYLQTNDYISGTSGVKINLKDGKIDAYSFSLNAGTDDTGKVQLNSNPEENGNYLLVGNNNQFIKLDKEGNLSISATDFTLSTDNIYLSATPNSDNLIFKIGENFKIDKDGILNATGGVFEGSIKAETGEIAGWKIGSFTDGSTTYTGSLYRDAGDYRIFLRSDYSKTTDAAIGIKKYETADKSDKGTYSFIVSHEGKLRATGVNISGIIDATSGQIGGWTLTSTSLKAGSEGSSGFIGLWTSYPTDANYRLRIGSKFSVDKDGNLYCSGGNFSGDISGATGTFKGSINSAYGFFTQLLVVDYGEEGLGGFTFNGSKIKWVNFTDANGNVHSVLGSG